MPDCVAHKVKLTFSSVGSGALDDVLGETADELAGAAEFAELPELQPISVRTSAAIVKPVSKPFQ